MLIWGGVGWGASDDGAFGFSKDKSLVYCANTLSWGGAPAADGAPLPFVMKISPGAKKPILPASAYPTPPPPPHDDASHKPRRYPYSVQTASKSPPQRRFYTIEDERFLNGARFPLGRKTRYNATTGRARFRAYILRT